VEKLFKDKKEYQQFITRMETLGKLEEERIDSIKFDPVAFDKEIHFLNEMYDIYLSDDKIPKFSEQELQEKVLSRTLLNKLEVSHG
jgi:hypothetical protein